MLREPFVALHDRPPSLVDRPLVLTAFYLLTAGSKNFVDVVSKIFCIRGLVCMREF
jgi:hypothetical protein